MAEVSTNTTVAPISFFKSLPLEDEVKHSPPKQPGQEIGTLPKLQSGNKFGGIHADYSWTEPREIYYAVSPTANMDLHCAGKDIILEVLKHGLLKRLHEITQQESNEISPPFALTIVPLTVHADLEDEKSVVQNDILERLDTISRWREGRDDEEHEPEKPSQQAIDRAKQVVGELLGAVISEGKPLHTPFVSYDQEGYINVVWRKGNHELYLEINEDEIEYVKVWGANIDSEMDAGVPSKENYLTLWEWLLDERK